MDFDFDPAKSERNFRERGFDFVYAAQVFLGRVVSFADERRDYGEVRMIAIGEIDGRIFTVIYTDRADARRIISAHRASRQEVRKWQEAE